jgi:hypothetical protein
LGKQKAKIDFSFLSERARGRISTFCFYVEGSRLWGFLKNSIVVWRPSLELPPGIAVEKLGARCLKAQI